MNPFDRALLPVDVHRLALALHVLHVAQGIRDAPRQLHLVLHRRVRRRVKVRRGVHFFCEGARHTLSLAFILILRRLIFILFFLLLHRFDKRGCLGLDIIVDFWYTREIMNFYMLRSRSGFVTFRVRDGATWSCASALC